MISVSEARERILSALIPVGTESVPLDEAMGRVLFEAITASEDLPSFDNSSVDGFAVHSSQVYGSRQDEPVTLRVSDDIPAGAPPGLALEHGTAARIMTGAPLPDGADTVVMLEDTDLGLASGGYAIPTEVRIFRPAGAGENVRARGSDIRAGQVVFAKGHLIGPADIGLLAQLGIARVQVLRRPRVAIFSSGDELIPVNAPSMPGKVRDTNSLMLAALAQAAGADVIKLGIARDDKNELESLLKRAIAEEVDLIISSAGVSVGAYDYVRAVVESNGKLDFWRVNMRPGKPLAFGQYDNTTFIGLPGNPVSAFVGFLVFAAPAIHRLAGIPELPQRLVRAISSDLITSDGRESYLRGNVREQGDGLAAELVGHQGSGNLFSLTQANALLIIPSGVKSVPPGEEVIAWLL